MNNTAEISVARGISNCSRSSFKSKMQITLAVVVGMCVGAVLQSHLSMLARNDAPSSVELWAKTSSISRDKKYATSGVVRHLEDVPHRNTSHVDTEGHPITKQQLLEPFHVPNFVGFSVATFKPGQTVMPVHEHESMHEFFYILEGTGVFKVNGVDHPVKKGTFLHMAPREKHGMWNPKEGEDGDLVMAVCGVTLD